MRWAAIPVYTMLYYAIYYCCTTAVSLQYTSEARRPREWWVPWQLSNLSVSTHSFCTFVLQHMIVDHTTLFIQVFRIIAMYTIMCLCVDLQWQTYWLLALVQFYCCSQSDCCITYWLLLLCALHLYVFTNNSCSSNSNSHRRRVLLWPLTRR